MCNENRRALLVWCSGILLKLTLAVMLLPSQVGSKIPRLPDTLGWGCDRSLAQRHTSSRVPLKGIALRGGSAHETSSEDDDFLLSSDSTSDTEKKWKNPRSGRYKDLQDDETAIQWRIADWYMDRRGQRSKERHARRQIGHHAEGDAIGLRKRPAGSSSRRDKQEANAFHRELLAMEMLSFGEMMFAGTGSGLIGDADKSDVYGRRWLETEEGKKFQRERRELEEFAELNETCAQYARFYGRTKAQMEEVREERRRLKRELEEETRVKLASSEKTSSVESDSIGKRVDWGWRRRDDGSFEQLGNWNFTDRGPDYVPKILRNWDLAEDDFRHQETMPDEAESRVD